MNRKIYLETSKDGYSLLRIENNDKRIYMGSKYNQKNNISKFIGKIEIKSSQDIIFIIGLGLGEYLNQLLEKVDRDNKVLIIEPDNEIYEKNIKNESIKNKINKNNIKYFNYKEEKEFREFLNLEINGDYIGDIKANIYTNYDVVYTEECLKIVKLLSLHYNEFKVRRNTIMAIHENCMKSSIENMKNINEFINCNKFKGAFKDKTSVIVSSGPSLAKNISKLKDYKEDVIIITGLRSVKELMMNGIKPHFIAIVDSHDIMFDLFGNVNEDIPLITIEQANSKILSNYRGKKLIAFNNFKNLVTDVMNEEYIELDVGGSVAHLCTSFSIFTGIRNIIFIGQDLAYTNMEQHSKNSSNEIFDSKLKETEIDKNSLKKVHGNVEEYVYTDSMFLSFKENFETIIRKNPEVNFINATEGGAKIKGTKVTTLKKALDIYSEKSNDDINQIIKSLTINNYTKNGDELIKFISNKIDPHLKFLKKAISLSEQMIKYYKFGIGNIDSIIKKLDKIDSILEENVEIAYMINGQAYKHFMQINNDSKYKPKINENYDNMCMRISKKNLEIYKAQMEATKQIIKIIEGE